MAKFVKTLLIGGAVGAALGVLYAPQAGEKTRATLADKADKLWGEEAQANGTVLGEVAKTTKSAFNAGQEFVASTPVAEKVSEAAKTAKAQVENFKNDNVSPVFSEKNDELRKKIDAARQKISNQTKEAEKTDPDSTGEIK